MPTGQRVPVTYMQINKLRIVYNNETRTQKDKSRAAWQSRNPVKKSSVSESTSNANLQYKLQITINSSESIPETKEDLAHFWAQQLLSNQ